GSRPAKSLVPSGDVTGLSPRPPRGLRLDGNRVEGTNPVSGAKVDLVLHHPDEGESARLDLEFADFSPNGRWLVTTERGQTACVWDVKTGEPKTPLLRH